MFRIDLNSDEPHEFRLFWEDSLTKPTFLGMDGPPIISQGISCQVFQSLEEFHLHLHQGSWLPFTEAAGS